MITSTSKISIVGFVAVSIVMTGLVGCGESYTDPVNTRTSSAPKSNTEPVRPPVQGDKVPKSIKNRPRPGQ